VCLMIYRRLNAGLPPIRMSRRSQSSSPAVLEADNFDEGGLQHLIASWQGLRAGVLKAILETYRRHYSCLE